MTKKHTPEELAAAEAKAAEDATLLEQVDSPNTEEIPPQEDREPTLADRYVGIIGLIMKVRKDSRLSEATLIKAFEVALQYHAWQTQIDQQNAQQQMQNMFSAANNSNNPEELIGPEPDEIITETPDNIIEGNFTPQE